MDYIPSCESASVLPVWEGMETLRHSGHADDTMNDNSHCVWDQEDRHTHQGQVAMVVTYQIVTVR